MVRHLPPVAVVLVLLVLLVLLFLAAMRSTMCRGAVIVILIVGIAAEAVPGLVVLRLRLVLLLVLLLVLTHRTTRPLTSRLRRRRGPRVEALW